MGMGMHNIMEDIVKEVFSDFKKEYALPCQCKQCQDDILALVLNRLPAKYVSRPVGELYGKLQSLNRQMYMDIMKELTQAAFIVGQHPHHEKKA